MSTCFGILIEPEREQYIGNNMMTLWDLMKKNDLKVTLYFSIINGETIGPFPDWIGNPSLKSFSEDRVVKVLDAILSRYHIVDSVIIAAETDEHFRYQEQNIPVHTKNYLMDVYDKNQRKTS